MKIIYLLSTIFILFSCQTLRIEKRVHSKGYAVFWNKKAKASNNEAEKSFTLTEDKANKTSKKELADNVLEEEQTDSISATVSNAFPELSKENSIPSAEQEILHADGSEATIHKDQLIEKENNIKAIDSETDDSENSKLAFLALAFPFLIPFFSKRRKQTQLQHWAKDNKNKARWSIVGLSLFTGATSFLLGHFFSDYSTPELLPLSFVTLCGASAVYMLSENKSVKTKALIGTSGSSSLLLFASGMIDDTVYIEDTTILPWWAIVLLMIVLVAAVVGASILVGVLACSLSCSSAPIWTVLLVGYGGMYLVLFFGFWAGFSLFKRQSQRNTSFAGKAALWALGTLLFFTLLSFFGAFI